MRYAAGYWKLNERRRRDGIHMSLRDQFKYQRIKSAVSEICEELECKPAFGHSLNLMVNTGEWQKIIRVPII